MPSDYKDIINECIDQVTGVTTINSQNSSGTEVTDTTKISATKPGPFTSQLSMLVEDSDETESVQEDPNDPEWFEPPQRIPKLQ